MRNVGRSELIATDYKQTLESYQFKIADAFKQRVLRKMLHHPQMQGFHISDRVHQRARFHDVRVNVQQRCTAGKDIEAFSKLIDR